MRKEAPGWELLVTKTAAHTHTYLVLRISERAAVRNPPSGSVKPVRLPHPTVHYPSLHPARAR
jgi:hypothetical protein